MKPIPAIVVTLGLLALFIAALIVGSRLIKRSKKEQRQAFAAAATARGWTYEPSTGGLVGLFGSKPFRKGAKHSPRAMDVISGRLDGHAAVAFRYRYTRGTDPDNLSDIYSWYTVCAVALPKPATAVRVDRGNPLVRSVMNRGLTVEVDGNWLTGWEHGTRATPEEVFARLELLVAIMDGSAGQLM